MVMEEGAGPDHPGPGAPRGQGQGQGGEQQQQQQQQQPGEIRSIHSRDRSFLRLRNMTASRRVVVNWIDFQGREVGYGRLNPRDYIDINTFATHPWVFVDEETEERLPGNGSLVYLPAPWFEALGENPRNPVTPQRIEVQITCPMYTLQELCKRAIKRRLARDSQAFELEIPLLLQREIWGMRPRKLDDDEPRVTGAEP